MRIDHRDPNQIREIQFTPKFTLHPEGSVLIELGLTRVLCTASVEQGLPKWLQGSGKGWVTAEYGMLPRSTHTRTSREKTMNAGRTQEIARLIGRSLRAVTKLEALGDRQIIVDCDVLQADGGTRTAAITGGFVALVLALQQLKEQRQISTIPIKEYLAAISVGIQNQNKLLDLNYEEDSSVSTDMNFVLTSKNKIVEVQGTAEESSFSKADLDEMYDLAVQGCQDLFREQEKIIGQYLALNVD